MSGYSPAFKKGIEERINKGAWKVSGKSTALVPSTNSDYAEINKPCAGID